MNHVGEFKSSGSSPGAATEAHIDEFVSQGSSPPRKRRAPTLHPTAINFTAVDVDGLAALDDERNRRLFEARLDRTLQYRANPNRLLYFLEPSVRPLVAASREQRAESSRG